MFLPPVLGVTSAVAPIFNIKCSHSASYSGATCNRHLSENFISLSLPMTVLTSQWE